VPRSGLLPAAAALLAGAALVILLPTAALAASRDDAPCAPDSGAQLGERHLTVEDLQQPLACSDLRSATLDGLDLTQADLHGADLRQASLVGTTLGQANLSGADLTGATLTKAHLAQATLTGARVAGIHARGADLTQVDLHGLDLNGADLRGTDLSQTDLRKADLRTADLTGADLTQADLRGTDLRGATITGAVLDEATTDATTTMDPQTAGMFPLDAAVGIVTLLVALLALRPRLAGRAPGRAVAVAAVVVIAAVTVAEIVGEWGWAPSLDDLFFLPMITPLVFLGIFAGGSVRRARSAGIAAITAVLGLGGFALLSVSGLALLVGPDAFDIAPLTQTCSTAACGFGLTRGWIAIVVGVVLLIAARVVAISGGPRPAAGLPVGATIAANSFHAGAVPTATGRPAAGAAPPEPDGASQTI
jgi:uncharacterized protein YjbI with pentapeptide repeats